MPQKVQWVVITIITNSLPLNREIQWWPTYGYHCWNSIWRLYSLSNDSLISISEKRKGFKPFCYISFDGHWLLFGNKSRCRQYTQRWYHISSTGPLINWLYYFVPEKIAPQTFSVPCIWVPLLPLSAHYCSSLRFATPVRKSSTVFTPEIRPFIT